MYIYIERDTLRWIWLGWIRIRIFFTVGFSQRSKSVFTKELDLQPDQHHSDHGQHYPDPGPQHPDPGPNFSLHIVNQV